MQAQVTKEIFEDLAQHAGKLGIKAAKGILKDGMDAAPVNALGFQPALFAAYSMGAASELIAHHAIASWSSVREGVTKEDLKAALLEEIGRVFDDGWAHGEKKGGDLREVMKRAKPVADLA